METISTIFTAFFAMTLPAQMAVIFFVGFLMFVPTTINMYAPRIVHPKRTKHARRPFQNNSEKEDFFDMVTRFREELV